jgi:protein gp37
MEDIKKINIRTGNWEIVTGCERLTYGCDSCPSYLDYKSRGQNYDAIFNKECLDVPLENPLPTRYTVALGSDIFHEAVVGSQLLEIFDVMKRCSRHYFEIVTKRAERCAYISKDLGLHYGMNVSLGMSVEDKRSKWRIEYLKETEAKIKIVSMVPLLGDMGKLDLDGIALVGVAKETWGYKRPCHEEWIDRIEMQCKEQGVVFSLDEIDIFHTFQETF